MIQKVKKLKSGVLFVENQIQVAKPKIIAKPKITATEVKGTFEQPISYHMYGVFMQWLLANRSSEIAGFFSIEGGTIRWAVRCSNDRNGSHVTMAHEQQMEAMKLLDEENKNRMALNEEKGTNHQKLTFDGQFHTHPNFSAFWSGTDENDQEETVYDQVDFNPEGGTTMFMVYNLSHMRLRKWWWNLGTEGIPEIFYQEGVVTLGGEKVNVPFGIDYRSRSYTPPINGGYQDGSYNYYNPTGGYSQTWIDQEGGEIDGDFDPDAFFMLEWLVEAYDDQDQDGFRQAIESLTDREFMDIIYELKIMDRADIAEKVQNIYIKLSEEWWEKQEGWQDNRETPEDFGQRTYVDTETGEVVTVNNFEDRNLGPQALRRLQGYTDNEEETVKEDDPTDGLPY